MPDRRQFFTRLAFLERDREVGLKFHLVDADGSYSTSDKLDLGSVWSDDGEHCRITLSGLFTFSHADREFDIEPIAEVTRRAAVALAAVL